MNRRQGAWWTFLGSLALGACIDSHDSLVGEVEPDDGTGGMSGTGGTSSTGGNGAMSGSDATGGSGDTGGTAGNGGDCTPGTTRAAGCNACTCSEDRRWHCTTAECRDCVAGETRPAADGCNTCTCVEGFSWSCTQRLCGECEPGEIVPTLDGCNSCTCDETGQFSCTTRECGECPPPEEPGPCAFPYHYSRVSENARCCFYVEACSAPVPADGWAYTSYASCMAGRSDYGRRGECDGDPSTVYETDLMTSVENCGACGYVCPGSEDALVSCVEGECIFTSCPDGWSDCNSSSLDGCEYQGTCGE